MPPPQLRISRQEHLALIEIDRPQVLNAIDRATLGELQRAFRELRRDEQVHGVLLTGSGENFAAGADLKELRELTPLAATRFAELGQSLCLAMEQLGKPLLAAVSGYTLGAGLELALACDFILCGDDARFGFKEIEYGLIPAFGGTQRLPRRVGKAKAKELIFTGALLDAAEALRIRLVNRVCPVARLRSEALELLASVCRHSLLALRLAKEVVDAGCDIPLAAACRMERDAFALCFATEDQKEGMAAFVEKRRPCFRGR